jgi:hypothetical protein
MEMYLGLRNAEGIGELRERLPTMTSQLEGHTLDSLTALLSEYFDRLPDVHGGITASFLTRLKSPTHILHIPVKVLGSTNADLISSTPFKVMGDILLFDIDCLVEDIITQLRQNLPVGDILSNLEGFHERVSSFNEEIEVQVKSAWGQRLASARTRISDMLEREIRQLPGLMREYVKDHGNQKNDFFHPSGPAHDKIGSAPSQAEKMLVHALGLMKGCKPYLDQLSINNTMRKVENEVDQITDYARIIGKNSVLSNLEVLTGQALDFSTGR